MKVTKRSWVHPPARANLKKSKLVRFSLSLNISDYSHKVCSFEEVPWVLFIDRAYYVMFQVSVFLIDTGTIRAISTIKMHIKIFFSSPNTSTKGLQGSADNDELKWQGDHYIKHFFLTDSQTLLLLILSPHFFNIHTFAPNFFVTFEWDE